MLINPEELCKILIIYHFLSIFCMRSPCLRGWGGKILRIIKIILKIILRLFISNDLTISASKKKIIVPFRIPSSIAVRFQEQQNQSSFLTLWLPRLFFCPTILMSIRLKNLRTLWVKKYDDFFWREIHIIVSRVR